MSGTAGRAWPSAAQHVCDMREYPQALPPSHAHAGCPAHQALLCPHWFCPTFLVKLRVKLLQANTAQDTGHRSSKQAPAVHRGLACYLLQASAARIIKRVPARTGLQLGQHGLQHGRVVRHAAGHQLAHERALRRQLRQQRAQLVRGACTERKRRDDLGSPWPASSYSPLAAQRRLLPLY